ncbi:vacuolar protein-sorting-associated protein 36 isoform X3 [Vanessa cardui]|uniref:vacuolar protein-sorting-associated protein 36 isoform X3 n=1 Tax=Vanessa cardui TaxID=171605 RepID=UPI001F148E15|nr:vacuolar protein-sorting-associated protein 36 isoform X3 [Vanessa cardui]
MGRLHTFVVTLRRDTRDTNWGLRLVGGSDLATPLIVTRVTPGTPAGRELTRGDIIAKIDHYDARDLRHEDAQNLFKNAPNQIKLVVQRSSPSSQLYTMPRSSNSFSGRSLLMPSYYRMAEAAEREGARSSGGAPRRTASPLPTTQWRGPESLPRSTPVPPQAQYAQQQQQYAQQQQQQYAQQQQQYAQQQPQYSPQQPQYSPQQTQYAPHQTQFAPQQTQFVPQQEGEYRTIMMSPAASNRTDETIDESIQSQPYRTTPLVLPGAKVRREPGPTESYLRHHPNPAMRAPPHHDYRDTLMRQKVVHKQFNSPINLYSEQNIANSIRQQTSPLPAPSAFDPAASPAARALAELEPAAPALPAAPVQHKLFSKKPAPTPTPKSVKQPETNPKGKQTTFVSSLAEEHIQQSSSFKRLMYHVLGDTQF